MSKVEFCITRLDSLIGDLLEEGVDLTFIIAALGEICVQTAAREPEHEQMHLDALAAVLQANAQAKRAGGVLQMARAIFDTP
jgi:hypothetical protein